MLVLLLLQMLLLLLRLLPLLKPGTAGVHWRRNTPEVQRNSFRRGLQYCAEGSYRAGMDFLKFMNYFYSIFYTNICDPDHRRGRAFPPQRPLCAHLYSEGAKESERRRLFRNGGHKWICCRLPYFSVISTVD